MEANHVSNLFEAVNNGSYQFSFFQLYVRVFEGLENPETLPELPQSTFFHEYIHFLQDITTTFGLVNASIVVNKAKHMNQFVLATSSSKFEIPIPLDDSPLMVKNNALQCIYMGYPSPTINKVEISHVELVNSGLFLGKPYYKQVQNVNVYYNVNGTLECFSLGGIHLCETICHLAQQHFNPDISHSDIPYRAGELVTENIYPAFANNPLHVVALCELCLMSMHPGEAFYKILHLMKIKNFLPKDLHDITTFVLDNLNYEGDQKLTDVFKKNVALAVDQLTGYFTTEIYDEEKKWVETVMHKAKDLRLKYPLLITYLLKQDALFSNYLKYLINELGSPLMKNIDGDFYWYLPKQLAGHDIRLDRFAAIQQIYDLSYHGRINCDLINFCRKSPEGNLTDNRCTESPWTRGRDTQLCSYGMFWKTWKLNGKEPSNS